MRDFFVRLLTTIIMILIILVLVVFAVPVAEQKYSESKAANVDEKATHWMRSLDDGLCLNEITIPGTHNSAAKDADFPFFADCQTYSVTQQLAMGYRYLDIRLESEKDAIGTTKLKLVHGISDCREGFFPWSKKIYLDNVLEECYTFLDTYPSETIVFVIKPESSEENIIDFQCALDAYIQSKPSKWLLTDSYPTLDNARGKIVLFRRYEDEARLGKKAGIALAWDDQPGKNDGDRPYEMTALNEKILYVQDHYEYGNNLKWSAFYYGMANPANPENGDVFINFLSTKGRLWQGHPFFHASVLNKRFKELTLDNETNYGWVIVDFADSEIATKLYSTNFKVN